MTPASQIAALPPPLAGRGARDDNFGREDDAGGGINPAPTETQDGWE